MAKKSRFSGCTVKNGQKNVLSFIYIQKSVATPWPSILSHQITYTFLVALTINILELYFT